MTPVRRLREQVGLTQNLLARLAGTTQQAVSRYETGKSSPTLKMLGRLAEAVGLRVIVTFVPNEPSEAGIIPPTRPEMLRSTPLDASRRPINERRDEMWTI